MSTSNHPPYHHGDLRRTLLEAALRMLERQGAAGLGLRDLARAVGVSPAAPYRHFDSRAALLEALAVTGFQRFTRAMNDTAASAPADLLMASGKTYVRFALDNPELFRLMFSPELRRDKRPGLKMAADAAFSKLQTVIGSDNRAGRFTALGAWAKVHGLATLLLDGQIALAPDEDMDQLISGILERH